MIVVITPDAPWGRLRLGVLTALINDLDPNRIRIDILLARPMRKARVTSSPGILYPFDDFAIGIERKSRNRYRLLRTIHADGSLRQSDNDKSRRFGGAAQPKMKGNPVIELQNDLTSIGYYLGNPDGDFGAKTHYAVYMFQEHFLDRKSTRLNSSH